MHVVSARPTARNGLVRARIDCTDPRGCVLARLTLSLHGRLAGLRTKRIAIPFGKRRTATARIRPAIWKRHRHARSLRVRITPLPKLTGLQSPAATTGSYPRTLTLRITR
jgi:hypothetical protein